MAEEKPDISEQLAKLQAKFEASLADRFDTIEQLWRELTSNQWEIENLKNLHRAVHSLTGSGANFGFVDLSDESRNIETVLNIWEKSGSSPSEEELYTVEEQLSALPSYATNAHRKALASTIVTKNPSKTQNSLIFLLEDDENLARSLQIQFCHFGYQVEYFTTETEIRDRLKRQTPDVLIIDIILDDEHSSGTRVMTELQQTLAPNVPFIIYSSRNDFNTRLTAVRAGASAYFAKPVDIDTLVDSLNKLTYKTPDRPYRIVIVDDDEVLTKHYSLILGHAGMKVTIVERPEDILETLNDVNPDLLLMDVYMPNCTGMELAQIIRQHEEYIALPIVFISTETSLLKHFAALRTGGDDFLCKPINDNHLVESLSFRAARARILKTQMTQDSLTRLLKHAKLKENLVIELSRAKRNKSDLSFVMIDLDQFKQVNDQHGHLTGDRVLKGLANIFRKRLRVVDTIGRYGGEEFAIILPQCDTASARKIVDEIRDDFSNIEFRSEKSAFNVSFSAGIANYPQFSTAEQINQAADLALYQAKDKGRNQTVIYNKETAKKIA